jgi:WD40 repeat protein
VTSLGDRAIVVDGEGKEALWDLCTGQCLYRLDGVGTSVEFESKGITVTSPESVMLVEQNGEGGVRIYDMQKGVCSHAFEPPPGQPLQGVAVSADGQRVVAVDKSQRVRRRRFRPYRCVFSCCLRR